MVDMSVRTAALNSLRALFSVEQPYGENVRFPEFIAYLDLAAGGIEEELGKIQTALSERQVYRAPDTVQRAPPLDFSTRRHTDDVVLSTSKAISALIKIGRTRANYITLPIFEIENEWMEPSQSGQAAAPGLALAGHPH